jgi:hypothetical protein
MKPLSRPFILLNTAAALIVVGSVVTVARSWAPEVVEACGERYRKGAVFALESAPGHLMTGADLQSRMGVDEWGVLDNLTVVPVSDAPSKSALKVKLEKAVTRAADGATERYGAGFKWAPRAFTSRTAACLTYSVKVPTGFVFGRGGQLPALGAAPSADGRELTGVSTALQWRERGNGEVLAWLGTGTDRQPAVLARDAFKLTPGSWTTLEQEVVLNTPGSSDGIVRLWVDGKLAMERKGIVLRGTAEQAIGGVNAEVTYGVAHAGVVPPPGQELMLTPFELRWK